jgi:ubiquinone/menaquinone biosynthesis C-methylase UbiE
MERVISEAMRAYYEQRAQEYDDWWLAEGRFAERLRPGWHQEVAAITAAVAALAPARTLDIACGTAFLSQHLRGELTAIDQSPAMVRIAADRLPHAQVLMAEAVPLPFADGEFERVFTAHFYGHLEGAERDAFLAEARRVGGELVVVDSGLHAGVDQEVIQERTLEDGSTHHVYKRFFTGEGLADELGGGEILHVGDWFVAVRSQ